MTSRGPRYFPPKQKSLEKTFSCYPLDSYPRLFGLLVVSYYGYHTIKEGGGGATYVLHA